MKKIIILLFIFTQTLFAQQTIQGDYGFHRQEMVGGFHFEGNKFQFFYSYGAIDRTASGTFSTKGDSLFLKSDKVPFKDFTVTKQLKSAKGYHLKFVDKNKYLVQGVKCIFIYEGSKSHTEVSNEKGEVFVDLPKVDRIFAMHTLFEDVLTTIKDEKSMNNNFTIKLNSSLEKVSFKGVDFHILDENILTCLPNYFMNMENIRFVKQ